MVIRAYTTLQIKTAESVDGKRTFKGIASSISTDRMGDVVEPKGANFKLPIPLLWQHNSREPIGWVRLAKASDKDITVECEIAKIDEPGKLKDRIDEAWAMIKAQLVRGLSIGFQTLESARIEGTHGIHFLKTEILELSAVTIPANQDATIQAIKSIDIDQRKAAIGHDTDGDEDRNLPGGTGRPIVTPKSIKGNPKMNIQERLAAMRAKRAATLEAMQAVMAKSADEGVTLTVEEQKEYDEQESEIDSIDGDIKRLEKLEKSMIESGTSVTTRTVPNAKAGTSARGGVVITSAKSNLPPGTSFARYAIAIARSRGDLMQAVEISKTWKDSPEVEIVLRAAVAAGTTTDATWAAPLVQYQDMANEFIELLRPQTIIGKIQGLRKVPFNVRMPVQTTGSTVGWVGEGAPKPVSALAFDTATLRSAKCAGIVVLTDELVRNSSPSAEAIVSQDLRDAIAEFTDGQFIDPTVAEVSNVSPASITNGTTAIPTSGNDAAAVREDMQALFGAFVAANLTPANGVFIMSATTALALSMMMNPLGQPEFPGLTMMGGTFMGLPAVVSQKVGAIVVLANASDILLADDGGVTLDASREASLQMDSAPDAPVAATTVMVSLWQHNMVGLRAERYINWKRRRLAAVKYISGVAYGTTP